MSTVTTPVTGDGDNTLSENTKLRTQSAAFAKMSSDEEDDSDPEEERPTDANSPVEKLPAEFHELPIELISLTDRYVAWREI